MAIKDLNEIYQEYNEVNKFRAFLYSPSNELIKEVEMINPTLNLRKRGFHTLEFALPSKIFDLGVLENQDNDLIDYTLDGYEVEVWLGDLQEAGSYDVYRFIIKGKPSSMSDDKPEFRYSALSSEYELQQIPIINWPGINVMAYKQTTMDYSSELQVANVSNPILTPKIYLTKEPINGTVSVTRVHTTYEVEIPLLKSEVLSSANIGENEYFIGEDGTGTYIQAYVPANTKLPVDDGGTLSWNDPVDEYKYYIYYETEEAISSGDIVEGTFEESPYYKQDGLTINGIVEDLFLNVNPKFLGWSANTTSFIIDEVRSGITFANSNVHTMLEALAENYNVYMHYDTVNRIVTIMPNDFGQNTGLRFEYGKYLKGIEQEYNLDNMVNYVQGQDASSVGFADISWTGDNYVENYDYYLDGAAYNGSSLIGYSRWLTTELATELAKIKYYQGVYNEEVWGSETFKGIANQRQELFEAIVDKEFELEEINAEIVNYDGLIENYNALTDTVEDQQIKNNLDVSARKTAYFVAVDEGDNVNNFAISGISITPNSVNTSYVDSSSVNFASQNFNTFKLNGTIYPEKIGYTSSIKLEFFNGATSQKVKYITQRDLNKTLSLNETITADSLTITFRIRTSGFSTEQPQHILSLDIISPKVKSWTTFVERQEYLKGLAEIKRNSVETEISILRDGPENIDFNEALAITSVEGYGIAQFDLRLNYIRQFTSVNYSGLSQSAKTELKRIRRGKVYQNNDIVDSSTLFKAAQDFLEENKYPTITVSITSVSLLQAYEAYEDWKKVKIGEKIDIFVPELKISIEAEIQEISLDLQNYSMGLVISTTQNYDNTFGKYFSKVYRLLNGKVNNVINPTEKPNQGAVETSKENSEIVEQLGGETTVGYTEDGNNTIDPDEIVATEIYIDPATERLVTTPPQGGSGYLIYGNSVPGVAKLTNGGFYIKDEQGNLRISLTSRNGLVAANNNKVTMHLDMEGNAKFGGTLEAASGTFGNVSIDAGGEFSVGDNITINNSGITAKDNANAQTLLIDANTGEVYIRGTIQEGTTFEDIIARSVNVIGGTRVINYDENGDLIAGTNGGTFEARVYANGNLITTGLTYSWSPTGVLSGTSTTSSFSPTVSTTYDGSSTQVLLEVTYSDSNSIETIIPIVVTRGGLQGIDGYNQAHIYLYKRASSLPTLGTIAATYTFATGVTVLNTNTQGWSLAIPSGTETLYITVATASSQNSSINLDHGDFTTPVKFSEDGSDGSDGLNVASVYIYKRDNTLPTTKPIGDTTYTFATGDISFNNANGWSDTVPSTGGDNVYIRIATASSQDSTDIIADTEWSDAGLLSEKGDEGTPAKVVQLNANSQVIQLKPDNKTDGSQAIIFDVETQGDLGTLGFTFTPNQGSFDTNTNTLTFADNTTYVFPMSVTYGDGAIKDSLTIIGVREVLDGQDSISAFLTNEVHTVASDADGSNPILPASTDFVIYEGLSDSSSSWSITASTLPGLTANINNQTYTVTEMTIDNAQILLTASKTGYSDIIKIFTISKSKQGEIGNTSPRVVSGILYYQQPEATAPSISFTGVTYTISSNSFSGLPLNWSDIPPVYNANQSNLYWYIRWTGQETGAETNLINTFNSTSPSSAINFDGVVTFTDIAGDKVLTTSDITSIQGGLLKTSKIQSSDATYDGDPDPLDSDFITAGMHIDLNVAEMKSNYFSLTNTGLKLRGHVESDSGEIGGWTIGADKLSAGNITLDATLGAERIFIGSSLDPNVRFNNDGTFRFGNDAATNYIDWNNSILQINGDIGGNVGEIEVGDIDVDGISISPSGILGKQSGVKTFEIPITGSPYFAGTIESSSGSVGGWSIGTNGIYKSIGLIGLSGFFVDLSSRTGNSSETGLRLLYEWLGERTSLVGRSNYIKIGGLGIDPFSVSGSTGTSESEIDMTAGASLTNVQIDGSDSSSIPSLNIAVSPGSTAAGARASLRSFNDEIFTIIAHKDLVLRAGGGDAVSGSIYAETESLGAQKISVGALYTRRSSKLLKEDINEIDEKELINLFREIEIKGYKYIDQNDSNINYSIIIEDELKKGNKILKEIIKREKRTSFYTNDNLPEKYRKYIGTELVTKEKDRYYINPLSYDMNSMYSLNIKATSIAIKKIDELEKENKKLRDEIEKIKEAILKIGVVI